MARTKIKGVRESTEVQFIEQARRWATNEIDIITKVFSDFRREVSSYIRFALILLGLGFASIVSVLRVEEQMPYLSKVLVVGLFVLGGLFLLRSVKGARYIIKTAMVPRIRGGRPDLIAVFANLNDRGIDHSEWMKLAREALRKTIDRLVYNLNTVTDQDLVELRHLSVVAIGMDQHADAAGPVMVNIVDDVWVAMIFYALTATLVATHIF
jgi:hypothetical protein